MIYEKQSQYPFNVLISFHILIDKLSEIAQSDVDYRANYAKALLSEVEKFPELYNGMVAYDQIVQHKDLIRNLLADLFPTALTHNEIKAVTIPFYNIAFNFTERFQNILNNAGPNFDITLKGYDEDHFYIMSCCIILNNYFKAKIDFSQPVFYDIPNSDGITEHYRITYNGDFMEIIPTKDSLMLTQEEIQELVNNYDNIALWKNKFPPGSWILKGFGIMSLFNSTTEISISNLKTNLIGKREDDSSVAEKFESIFRSIFKIKDLKVGYTAINDQRTKFINPPFNKNVNSFILDQLNNEDCNELLCEKEFEDLLQNKKYFTVSDIEIYLNQRPESYLAQRFFSKGIKSVIFAPMYSGEKLLGVIEIISFTKNTLNSINARKMDAILPYLSDTIDRFYYDLNNEVEAIIQKEYTSIHPSVYWKFTDEALQHVGIKKNDIPFKEIVFNDVIPLYGQIDIKGSSVARNEAVKNDMIIQLDMLIELFKILYEELKLPVIYQNLYELQIFHENFNSELNADSESTALNFIFSEIHPILQHFSKSNSAVKANIEKYFNFLDEKLQIVYQSRKDYDDAIALINKKMASILDERQEEAQKFFPHYYERFKTDGVEHNLYIGASIAPKLKYSPVYLSNLKLWQLQVACEMELEYSKIKKALKYQLDVASLILVFSSPISIRFRMDEKRFDVDGTYNARYEVVKKRIDKSYIKGTNQRITEKGKITIVYSNQKEETEYKKYIHLLQHNNLLEEEIELLDVEDLQGVSGLKALRVKVKYS